MRWVRDDARPGRGRGLLRAALRPGAGDAVPRRRALLDPRVRAARRHRGAAARSRSRCCATRPSARFVYGGLGTHVGPARGRPRGDAGRRAPGRRAPAATRTATAAPSASTACSPPTGSGPPSSTPGCRPGLTHRRARSTGGSSRCCRHHLVAGVDTGLTRRRRRGAGAADGRARAPARSVALVRGHARSATATPTRSPGTARRSRRADRGDRQPLVGRRHRRPASSPRSSPCVGAGPGDAGSRTVNAALLRLLDRDVRRRASAPLRAPPPTVR